MRVLAICNELIARRLTQALKGTDMELICCQTLETDLLNENKYDLIIIDAMIGHIEEICNLIKSLKSTPVAPLIKNSGISWRQCSFLDVDGFLTEEAGNAEIEARIKTIVRRYSLSH